MSKPLSLTFDYAPCQFTAFCSYFDGPCIQDASVARRGHSRFAEGSIGFADPVATAYQTWIGRITRCCEQFRVPQRTTATLSLASALDDSKSARDIMNKDMPKSSIPTVVVVVAIATFCLLVCAGLTSQAASLGANANKIQLMFVQTAASLKADDTTLRLVNVGQQTLYFSDRPVRIAGHLTMPAYMDEWKAGEGPDDFAGDPPNATVSVYEPGHNDNTLTVVEISHPVIDGKDLVYSYKLIEGTMPKAGGPTALFIDWVGVGGGVGPGFHGVGAGARGVGVR